MNIIRFSVEHPKVIIILVPAVLLAGFFAFGALTRELLPDVNMPSVHVVTIYPGGTVEETERKVTEVLEKELSLLPGLTRIQSRSTAGRSVIQCTFTWDTDIDMKKQEVREQIDIALPSLPDSLPRPPMLRVFGAENIPIMTILLESSLPPVLFGNMVEDDIVPSLSRIPGVSAVNARGIEKQEVKILLDSGRLWFYSLHPSQVAEAVRRAGMTIPAGSLDPGYGEAALRAGQRLSSLEDLEKIVVGYRGAAAVSLADTAEVFFDERRPDEEAWSEGRRVITLDIYKRTGADTIATGEEAERILQAAASVSRADFRYTIIRDQRKEISDSIGSVASSAILGAILAVFVLFIFLHNLRATLIVTLSIPISVVLTFCALYLSGGSLNVTTLGGLAISLGMIVDAAIVVLESVHRRLEAGLPPAEAAIEGTCEVSKAVTASILTTLAVFVPLVFLPGFAGIVLRDISSTIVFALPASLLTALTVIPSFIAFTYRRGYPRNSGSGIGAAEKGGRGGGNPFKEKSGKFMLLLLRWYQSLLQKVLLRPWFTVACSAAVLIFSLSLYPRLGFDFIPEVDVDELILELELPPGIRREDARRAIQHIGQVIMATVPEVEAFSLNLGNRAGGTIKLDPARPGSRDVFRIADEAGRALAKEVPGVKARLSPGGLARMGREAAGGGFGVEVRGPGLDMDTLYSAALRIGDIFSGNPSVISVSLNVEAGLLSAVLILDAELLERAGIAGQTALAAARLFFDRADGGVFSHNGKDIDIILTGTPEGTLYDPAVLDLIFLPSPGGGSVPFSSFSSITMEKGFDAHVRENRVRAILVEADLRPGTLRQVRSETETALENLDREGGFPRGAEWSFKGTSDAISDAFRSLLFASIAAVILVYIVLVIQFERFRMPVIVMTAVPFILIGVMGTLLLFGSTLSVVSFLGIIALAGIVVNNAIVMIDAINRLRLEGMSLRDAIAAGAAERLKPVLMTTVTTVLGLAPLAFGLAPSSFILASGSFGSGRNTALLAPLGQTVMGGLATSTLVTLFLVPALYLLMEDNSRKRKHDSK